MNIAAVNAIKIGGVLAAAGAVIYFLSRSNDAGVSQDATATQTGYPAADIGISTPTTAAGSTGAIAMPASNIVYNIGAGGDGNLPVFDPSKYLIPLSYNSPDNQTTQSFLALLSNLANTGASGGGGCGCTGCASSAGTATAVASPVALAQAYAPLVDASASVPMPSPTNAASVLAQAAASPWKAIFGIDPGNNSTMYAAPKKGQQTLDYGVNGLPSLGNFYQGAYGVDTSIPQAAIIHGEEPYYNQFTPNITPTGDLELHYN